MLNDIVSLEIINSFRISECNIFVILNKIIFQKKQIFHFGF